MSWGRGRKDRRTDATESGRVGDVAADSVADVGEGGKHSIEEGVGSAFGSLVVGIVRHWDGEQSSKAAAMQPH